jgi:hypothetical protein
MGSDYRIISLEQLTAAPQRDCGECTACCDVMGVEELGKPYYARCSHLGDDCGIYESRPASCARFRCAWHLGLLGDSIDRRPDKSGLLFDIQSWQERGTHLVEIYETTPGALATERHYFLLKKLMAHRSLRDFTWGHPTAAVYPYGSKIHIGYTVSDRYDWTPPLDEMPVQVDHMKDPGVGQFIGEVSELSLPRS